MNKNKIKIIIGIVSTLILLLGSTYALITFLTDTTSVTMTVGGDKIIFNAGANITIDKIHPVYTMEEGITKDIEIYKEEGDYTAGIDLYLNLMSWPSVMGSSSFRWSLYKNGIYLSSGDFSGKYQGDNVKLTSYPQKINLEEKKDSYKLYLWIDARQESDIDMMNQTFTINLYGQTIFYENEEEDPTVNLTEPNNPDLADGMIPIKYNYVLDEWVKADTSNTNNDWYDYYNRMWANAVTVTTESREEYMNASVGTTVNEEDILAYYVWIPRYKYLLFNTTFQVMEPVEIQIEFQKETDEIFNGTENGEFLTHPAFWWDNNSDGVRDEGEELAGIWVGKFETTGTNDNPTIKPNLLPIVSNYLGTWLEILKKFNNTDYLTNLGGSTSDSHVIKNLEWGAVAYLSHSRYGKNKEVRSGREYSTYRTGMTNYWINGIRNNYTYNDFYVKEGKITSSKNVGSGIVASTTGNVYGIYGMSGGVHDAVAAGNLTNFGIKYFDFYECSASANDFSNSKLGDAIGETRGWYYDTTYSLSKQNDLYTRGFIEEAGNPGVFAANIVASLLHPNTGSRAVLILP